MGEDEKSTGVSDDPKKVFEPMFWDALVSDPKLRLCEPASKWVWILMCIYMAIESPDPGRLVIRRGGVCVRPELDDLERILFERRDVIFAAITDLEDHDVFSRDSGGVIISRRQIRKREKSKKAQESAKARWNKTKTGEGDSHPNRNANRNAISSYEYEYRSDPSSLREEVQEEPKTPLGRAPTPTPGSPPLRPTSGVSVANGERIPNDFSGRDQLIALWNALKAPTCVECVSLEPNERSAVARLLSAGDERSTVAWHERWIKRTHTAKFLPHKTSGPATLQWFLVEPSRIESLLRGEYDRAPNEAATNGTKQAERPEHRQWVPPEERK